jgi:hypothetical protein
MQKFCWLLLWRCSFRPVAAASDDDESFYGTKNFQPKLKTRIDFPVQYSNNASAILHLSMDSSLIMIVNLACLLCRVLCTSRIAVMALLLGMGSCPR